MEKCREEHQPGFNRQRVHRGHEGHRGPSSFYKLDSTLAFEKMNLKTGNVFVDLGCGAGDYSLYAAKTVGEKGKVYAVDIWTEIFEGIKERARSLQLTNIETVASNICQEIPLKDNCADHCLLSTVMHAQKITGECKNLFTEIVRILKPKGQLAIIECKKEETQFGPPMNMRVSPEELKEVLVGYGFSKQDYVDLGFYYMVLFENHP